MITHILQVKDRDIAVDNRMLYKGTANEDRVQLVLDDEWDGLDIALTFKGSGNVAVPAIGEDGYYPVPWEVQTEAGDVYAIVDGSDRDGKVMRHAIMSKPFRVIDTNALDPDVQPTLDSVTEAIRECNDATADSIAATEASRDQTAKAKEATDNANATADKVAKDSAQAIADMNAKADAKLEQVENDANATLADNTAKTNAMVEQAKADIADAVKRADDSTAANKEATDGMIESANAKVDAAVAKANEDVAAAVKRADDSTAANKTATDTMVEDATAKVDAAVEKAGSATDAANAAAAKAASDTAQAITDMNAKADAKLTENTEATNAAIGKANEATEATNAAIGKANEATEAANAAAAKAGTDTAKAIEDMNAKADAKLTENTAKTDTAAAKATDAAAKAASDTASAIAAMNEQAEATESDLTGKVTAAIKRSDDQTAANKAATDTMVEKAKADVAAAIDSATAATDAAGTAKANAQTAADAANAAKVSADTSAAAADAAATAANAAAGRANKSAIIGASATTLEPGSDATATLTQGEDGQTITIGVPKGAKGDAATIAVGTVTTGEPGTDAGVSNSGTTAAAVFDFTIPKGDKGDKGDKGEPGNTVTFTDGLNTDAVSNTVSVKLGKNLTFSDTGAIDAQGQISKWGEVQEKPFNTVGDRLTVTDGVLSADVQEPGNASHDAHGLVITSDDYSTPGTDDSDVLTRTGANALWLATGALIDRSKYTLPVASSTALGGVKTIGDYSGEYGFIGVGYDAERGYPVVKIDGSDFTTDYGAHKTLQLSSSVARKADLPRVGNESNAGIVKLSGSTNDSSGVTQGVAATPEAVKSAYDVAIAAKQNADSAITVAGEASTAAANALTDGKAYTDAQIKKIPAYTLPVATGTTLGGVKVHEQTENSPAIGVYANPDGSLFFAFGCDAPLYQTDSGSLAVKVGNAGTSGSVKLSDATDSGLGVSGGTAATPGAVKAAYDRGDQGVQDAATAANAALNAQNAAQAAQTKADANSSDIAKEKMNRYNADTAIKATIPARNNLIFPTALTTKTSGKTVRVTYAGNADIKKLVDQMKTAAVEGQMITAGFIVSFSDSDSDNTYSRGFIPFQDGFGAYKQDGSLLAGTYGGIYKTAAGSFKFREGFDGTYVDLGYSDADSLGQIVADVSRVLGVYWVTFPVSFTV